MNIRIVLADDHAILREGLTRLLESESDLSVVGTAANGREAVRRTLDLTPDVVILDIAMQDMNGIEAARQIHERSPDTGVVILSMHIDEQFVFQAFEAGARGYLDKDSVTTEIIDAVRAVHAGKRYLSPRIADVVADGMSRPRVDNPLTLLSRREREILQLVAEGHSSAKIGTMLNISPKTVDTYRSRLMQKLGLDDIASVVKFAIQQGLTSL